MLHSFGTRSPGFTSRRSLEAPLIAQVPVSCQHQSSSSPACSSSGCESTPVGGLRTRQRYQLRNRCGGSLLRQSPSQRSALYCAAQKRDPPDAPKEEFQRRGGREWLQTLLSRFGPLTDKAPNRLVLDFEKPLVELDNRIKEVKPSVCPAFGAGLGQNKLLLLSRNLQSWLIHGPERHESHSKGWQNVEPWVAKHACGQFALSRPKMSKIHHDACQCLNV